MISLKTQTIRIIAMSLVTVAIVGTVWVLLESRVQQRQRLFLEGSELAVAAPTQAKLLVTGLSVPLEFGSVPMHLETIKRQEKLTRVDILKSESELQDITKSFTCREAETQTRICVNRSQHKVLTVTPVISVNQTLGFLIKEKILSDRELHSTLFFPLLALISAFCAAFVVITFWIGRFLKNDVRQPLLNLKDTLLPVLQNQKGVRFPKFRVSEVQELAARMGQLVKEFEDRRVNSTIAETTKFLAHDLKRPINTVKNGLDLIQRATDPNEIKKLAASLQTDVERALSEADDIIASTMEFEEKPLVTVSVSPEYLIENSLQTVFRLYPKADVSLTYNFNHHSYVLVDVRKTLRVFTNILANAVEAMHGKGAIWFKTTLVPASRTSLIEFCIGNSNSAIAEEDISRIFDAYFTKGKTRGKGLGLALAHKVVSEHGGKIWCASLPGNKVEFHFTLPLAVYSSEEQPPKLPTHSRELSRTFNIKTTASPNNHEANRATIVDFSKRSGKKIVIQLIDDEPEYFTAFSSILKSDKALATALELKTAINGQEALKIATENEPQLVLCDYDMGKNVPNGLDILANLRRNACDAFICIHSAFPFTEQEIREAGADRFFGKPMDSTQLTELIATAILHQKRRAG